MLRARWLPGATRAWAIALLAVLALGALVTAGALGVGPGLGSASARPPTREEENAARALAEEGMAHYDRGEYAEAIVDFRAADAKVHSSLLVYNIAQAHRLNGDCAEAVQAYEAFLSEEPTFKRRKKVEAWIAEMRACAGRAPTGPSGPGDATGPTGPRPTGPRPTGPTGPGDATGPTGPRPTGPRPTGPDGSGTGAGPTGPAPTGAGGGPDLGLGGRGPDGLASATGPAPDDGARRSPAPPRRSGTRRALRLAGLATAGTGVVLGGLAAWSGVRARDASDEIASFVDAGGGVWSQDLAYTEDRGQRAETRALILASASAVLVGGGVALLVIGSRISTEPPPVTVAPAPAGAGTGATLVWSCDF